MSHYTVPYSWNRSQKILILTKYIYVFLWGYVEHIFSINIFIKNDMYLLWSLTFSFLLKSFIYSFLKDFMQGGGRHFPIDNVYMVMPFCNIFRPFSEDLVDWMVELHPVYCVFLTLIVIHVSFFCCYIFFYHVFVCIGTGIVPEVTGDALNADSK